MTAEDNPVEEMARRGELLVLRDEVDRLGKALAALERENEGLHRHVADLRGKIEALERVLLES